MFFLDSIKRSLYMIVPFAAYYVMHALFTSIGKLIYGMAVADGGETADFMRAHAQSYKSWSAVCVYVLLVIGLWILFKKSDPLENRLIKEKKGFIRILLNVFFFGGSAAVFLNILAGYIVDLLKIDTSGTSSFNTDTPFVPGLLLFVFLSPLVEEMTFRWLTFGRIRKNINVPAALVVSSLFFGVIHGDAVKAVYAFIMGFIMALIYQLSGTFVLAVVFHMAANAFIFIPPYMLKGGGASEGAGLATGAVMLLLSVVFGWLVYGGTKKAQ